MKVGLCLGGGGARGYAHIGAIKALEEAGISVDIINGTSMGAIIGGAYALYVDVQRLIDLVEEVITKTNLRYFNIFRFSTGRSQEFLRNWVVNAASGLVNLRASVLTHKTSQRALEMIFGRCRFADTRIPFSATSVDLKTWKTVVIKEGKLIDGVLPSISIPGVFPPIDRNRQLLVDGGVLANTPVVELRDQGADFIIAVRILYREETEYHTGFDLINRVELMKQHTLEEWELDAADIAVTIDLPGFNILKFDDYKTAVNAGYEITKKAIPQIKRRLTQRGK